MTLSHDTRKRLQQRRRQWGSQYIKLSQAYAKSSMSRRRVPLRKSPAEFVINPFRGQLIASSQTRQNMRSTILVYYIINYLLKIRTRAQS